MLLIKRNLGEKLLLRSIRKTTKNNYQRKFFYLLILAFTFHANFACASGGDIPAITDALQGLIDILTGTTAKLLATVAIIGVGYFWLSGRLSLKHAAYIGLGIGIVFGAPEIAAALGAV